MIRGRNISQLNSQLKGSEDSCGQQSCCSFGNKPDDHFFQAINSGLRYVVAGSKKPVQQKPKPKKKKLVIGCVSKAKLRKPSHLSVNPISDVFREFPRAQIVVRNTSASEKEIVLWGNGETLSVSPPAPEDIQDQVITTQIAVPTGIHPQGLAYNPANNLVYVVNQLSGTVTVIDSANQVVKVIQLEPTLPGFCSPVAVCTNTKAGSPAYGNVYVACSIANTVAVIDLSLNVIATVQAENRPVGIAYNPVNNRIYVCNLVSDTISLIDADTNQHIIDSGFQVDDPYGIAVHPATGKVFITCSRLHTIEVYDASYNFLTDIPGIGQRPVSITYSPVTDKFYCSATDSNQVTVIDPAAHTISATIAVGAKPYGIIYDSLNQFLYVQNREDNTFTVIRTDHSIAGTLTLGEQNTGGAYNPTNNSLYISDASGNLVNVISYLGQSSAVSVSDDYAELCRGFRYGPVLVKHVRMIHHLPELVRSLRIERATPTGLIQSKHISVSNYLHPENAANVQEVTGMSCSIIDGKTRWRFRLPAFQSLTMLIWHRQFKRECAIPNYKPNCNEESIKLPGHSLLGNTRRKTCNEGRHHSLAHWTRPPGRKGLEPSGLRGHRPVGRNA